jgi:hypothetical protein
MMFTPLSLSKRELSNEGLGFVFPRRKNDRKQKLVERPMMKPQSQQMKILLTSCLVLQCCPRHHGRIDVILLLSKRFDVLVNVDGFYSLVEYHNNESTSSNNTSALSRLTPGAYSNLPTTHKTNSIEDSLSLDISQLRKQYKKLTNRNKQVQIMIQSRIPVNAALKPRILFICLAASNEQRQRPRAPSIHPSPGTATDSFRRSTISSLEFSPPKLPSTVCSIVGGPLVGVFYRLKTMFKHCCRFSGQSSVD